MNNYFGNQLRLYRIKNRLSQEKLGEKIGVSTGYIGQLERGTALPSFDTLKKLIEVLQVDANIFFYDEVPRNSLIEKKITSVLSDLTEEQRKFLDVSLPIWHTLIHSTKDLEHFKSIG